MAIVAIVLSGIVLMALVALLAARRSRRPAPAHGSGDGCVTFIADGGGDCGADGGGCGDGGGGGGGGE